MRNPWYWVGVVVLVILVIWLVRACDGPRGNDGKRGNDWEIHPVGSVV